MHTLIQKFSQDVEGMIPYCGEKIFNLDDVKEQYPNFFDLQFLKRKATKDFYISEFEKLIKFWGPYKKPAELKPIAEARALYSYIWVWDNALAVIMSWGLKLDPMVLFNRMRAAGIEPFQISNVVGDFVSNMPRKKKHLKIKETSVTTYEQYNEECREEVPDDDGYDDYGAQPGQNFF